MSSASTTPSPFKSPVPDGNTVSVAGLLFTLPHEFEMTQRIGKVCVPPPGQGCTPTFTVGELIGAANANAPPPQGSGNGSLPRPYHVPPNSICQRYVNVPPVAVTLKGATPPEQTDAGLGCEEICGSA